MTCIVPGIDGMAPQGKLAHDACCPPSLCMIDPCMIACSMVQLLPRGPLWDRVKAETVSNIMKTRLAAGCSNGECPDVCASMADYAVFVSRGLNEALFGPLASALRESNPFTAYDTLDEWLERLGWHDCFSCACRDPDFGSELTPLEIWGPISDDGLCEGPICCPVEYPAELQRAVKRGTVVALARMLLEPPRRLDAINFVIAPLGARLEPTVYRNIITDFRCPTNDSEALCCISIDELERNADPRYLATDTDTIDPDRCDQVLRQYEFRIAAASDTLVAPVKLDCFSPRETAPGSWNLSMCTPAHECLLPAHYDTNLCGDPGQPRRLYPGVMAAECIVRSIMPRDGTVKLIRSV